MEAAFLIVTVFSLMFLMFAIWGLIYLAITLRATRNALHLMTQATLDLTGEDEDE